MKQRLPSWFKQEIPDKSILETQDLFSGSGINTICQEASCPNISYCFKNKKFTFIILGDTCTRNCLFCCVNKSSQAKLGVDHTEPQRISAMVRQLGLKYIVITSVSRDDLEDGGAGIFADTITAVCSIDASIRVEVLIPDFQGRIASLKRVLDAHPQVLAHNLETVNRLYPQVRPMADYQLSLYILSRAKELNSGIYTKSSLMLGLGEKEEEVVQAMADLRHAGCDILTLGQYLNPTGSHYPVREFIDIATFTYYEELGLAMGFKRALSGPLVRSSYRAEEVFYESNHA